MHSDSGWKAAWRKWVGFWFAPGDPTAMAFVRIVTGCLVVYVHLVYSFDLTAFFGKDAWYDLAAADRARKEEPHRLPEFRWEHEQSLGTATSPDGEAERAALFHWIRGLPTDRAELRRKLRLLDADGYLNEADHPDYPFTNLPMAFPQLATQYASELSPDPAVRANTLKALTKEIPRDKREAVPEVFDKLKPDQMKRFARDLEAFHSTLPPADKTGERKALVTYLNWLSFEQRNQLLRFLDDLNNPEQVKTEAEREHRIEYLRYWGQEYQYAERHGTPVFSIWFHISDPWEMRVAHGLILVVMLLFTVGLFTRVTSVLTWLAAASYLHRNPQVLFGQDTMMNILLVYLMIANCGAALSVDRVIARYRAVRASLKRCGRIDEPTAAFLRLPPPSPSSHFAQRLLQVHFCFIYMAAGLSKLKGGSWWSAEAMWQTLVNPEFTMIHFEWYQHLVRAVFSSRPLYAVAAAGGVAFTLFTEIGLPFLVWTRLRPWMLICGFLLHFGVGVFMGLLVFSLFMMTMLLAYLPGSVFRERLFGPTGEDPNKVKRPVDPTNDADCKKAAWAVATDLSGRVELVPTR